MQTQYKKFFTLSLWMAIVFVALRCLISWSEIIASPNAYDLYGYASESIAATIVVMTLYEKWLWRWNPWEKVPVLKHLYKGTLHSMYDDRDHPATIKIKQTLLSVHITFISEESKSESLVASIYDHNGETELIYTYLNTPKAAYRHRSGIQYGTARLCIDNPRELTGQYYTDRGTTGDMMFVADENDMR